MSWFDTHCHLQSFLREKELETVLQRAEDADVKRMVTVGTSTDDWQDYHTMAQEHPDKIDYSVGLHPGYVDEDWEIQLSDFEKYWVQEKAPLALGEIGLDYFRLPKDCELAEKIIFWQKKPCGSNLVLPVNSIVR